MHFEWKYRNGENTHWNVLIVFIKTWVWRCISVLPGVCAQMFWKIHRSWTCSHPVQPQTHRICEELFCLQSSVRRDCPAVQSRTQQRTNPSQSREWNTKTTTQPQADRAGWASEAVPPLAWNSSSSSASMHSTPIINNKIKLNCLSFQQGLSLWALAAAGSITQQEKTQEAKLISARRVPGAAGVLL